MSIQWLDTEGKETKRRIAITTPVVSNRTLEDLEQEYHRLEDEERFVIQRKTELKQQIQDICTALAVDMKKEMPLMDVAAEVIREL